MAPRRRRSTGSVFTPRDMLTVYREKPRAASQAADIAAVDRGQVVTVFCAYRSVRGEHLKRFRPCWLDLTPTGAVIRPLFLLQSVWRRIPVADEIVSCGIRPFKNQWEAMRTQATGRYAPGQSLEQAGSVIVECQTSGGVLEFAVHRPDAGLVLHYFGRLAEEAGRSGQS